MTPLYFSGTVTTTMHCACLNLQERRIGAEYMLTEVLIHRLLKKFAEKNFRKCNFCREFRINGVKGAKVLRT